MIHTSEDKSTLESKLLSNTAILHLSAEGRVLDFSDGFTNQIARNITVSKGDNILDILPHDLRRAVIIYALKAKKAGFVNGFLSQANNHNGFGLPQLSININYTDKDGYLCFLIPQKGLSRKSAEEYRKMEIMRTTLESMEDFVFVLDKNGLFSEFYSDNEKTSSTGISTNFAVGSGLEDVGFPEDVVRILNQSIKKIENNREPQQINYSIKAFGGELFYQAKISPRFSFNNTFEGVTVVSRDITSLIKSEQKLKKSLEYYLTVFDNFPTLIWRANRNQQVDYFNHTWIEFTGETMESQLDDGWKRSIHPEDQKKVFAEFAKWFDTQQPFTLEYRLMHNSGNYHWIKNFCEPLLDYKGRFSGYIGSCFDINDILETQRLLQQSESRYKTILDQQNDLVTRWKTDYTISFVNQAVSKFFGKSAEDFNGMNWIDLFPENQRNKLKQYLIEFDTKKKGGESIELQVYDRNNNLRFYQWLTAPIYDNNKNVVEYQSVGRDITEKIRKQKENQNLMVELRERIHELSLLNRISKLISTGNQDTAVLKKIVDTIAETTGDAPDNIVVINYQTDEYASSAVPEDQSEFKIISCIFNPEEKGKITVFLANKKQKSNSKAQQVSQELLNLIGEMLHNHFLKIEAEKKLRISELKYRELFDNALDIVFSIDKEFKIQKINAAANRILGVTNPEGNNIRDYLLPSEKANVEQIMKDVISEKENSFTFETKAMANDGDVKFLQVRGFVKYSHRGKPTEIFGIARDNTQQRKLEKSIMKTVISTEEKERKRFAEELHDGIGPLLSGLKMYLQQDTLENNLNDKQTRVLKFCRELVDDAISQARSIANNLTPGVLNDFGLEKALVSHVDKINAIGKFVINLDIREKLDDIDDDISLAVFRVTSELINNALKYAGCSKIDLDIDIKNNILKLNYFDDGKGLDMEQQFDFKKKGKNGVSNIHNRINSLNGSVTFDSAPKEGLRVKIFIPLKSNFV